MLKKLMILAFLLPGAGGCIWETGGHDGVIVAPIHAHCYGCHHVYRGGVWVIGN